MLSALWPVTLPIMAMVAVDDVMQMAFRAVKHR